EWKELVTGFDVSGAIDEQFAAAQSRVSAREAEAHETDARARREGLARVAHLVHRVEAAVAASDLSLKVAERALRDVRTTLGAMPPLPTKQDFDDISRRLKAAQSALVPKVQELREAAEWQRWANVGIQEQLCARMEALRA